MVEKSLDAAIERLAGQFARRDWGYLDAPAGDSGEKAYAWPGPAEDNIMICVHKGPDIEELFHRQDFFFSTLPMRGTTAR